MSFGGLAPIAVKKVAHERDRKQRFSARIRELADELIRCGYSSGRVDTHMRIVETAIEHLKIKSRNGAILSWGAGSHDERSEIAILPIPLNPSVLIFSSPITSLVLPPETPRPYCICPLPDETTDDSSIGRGK